MSPLLTGFAFGGAAGTPKATYTATTGSPTIDTSSRPGKTIIKYTGSGSITIGTAGYAEILVIGGGGAGFAVVGNTLGSGGGGAGGYLYNTSAFLPSGTLNVTVAAPSVGGSISDPVVNSSFLGIPPLGYLAFGGSSYIVNQGPIPGGSGAGGSQSPTTGWPSQFSQGNAGGNNTSAGGGGGGGAGAAGGVGTGTGTSGQGGVGGAGLSNTIIGGSAIFYAGGGGGAGSSASPGTKAGGAGGGGASSTVSSGATATSGTANTGGGGGGAISISTGPTSAGAGGSGYVVVVIG
jgi:hypothetical protein